MYSAAVQQSHGKTTSSRCSPRYSSHHQDKLRYSENFNQISGPDVSQTPIQYFWYQKLRNCVKYYESLSFSALNYLAFRTGGGAELELKVRITIDIDPRTFVNILWRIFVEGFFMTVRIPSNCFAIKKKYQVWLPILWLTLFNRFKRKYISFMSYDYWFAGVITRDCNNCMVASWLPPPLDPHRRCSISQFLLGSGAAVTKQIIDFKL